jgi:predicted transposase YbfD/YdcC
VPAAGPKRGPAGVVWKEHQPLIVAAVALSFADPWTPRQRVAVGDRPGDRAERRTREGATEGVPDLAQAERLDAEEGEAGTLAGWPRLAQVCRLHCAVEFVSGRQAGTTRQEWSAARTSVPPEPADAARLAHLWRGHWQMENGWHHVRDVTLGEDACQVRMDRAPANLAACRTPARTLLRRAASPMSPPPCVAMPGIPRKPWRSWGSP